jgi:hypothetical protein
MGKNWETKVQRWNGSLHQAAQGRPALRDHHNSAVLAAHDSGALYDHNYDIHWPLNLAVELLEQASAQFSILREGRS